MHARTLCHGIFIFALSLLKNLLKTERCVSVCVCLCTCFVAVCLRECARVCVSISRVAGGRGLRQEMNVESRRAVEHGWAGPWGTTWLVIY